MVHPAAQPLMTEEEYLAVEKASDVRHEFVAGRVHAMSGASRRHNTIAGNLFARLRALARAEGRRAFMSDVKVRVPMPGSKYYYPDVVVVCDPGDVDERTVHAPCLVVEVTSPSTEMIDFREKADAYRAIPSLRGYLIVDQQQRHVTRYWRDARDRWYSAELWNDDVVPLPCPGHGVELTMDEIYDGLVNEPM